MDTLSQRRISVCNALGEAIPYADPIRAFFVQQFPANFGQVGEMLDAVTAAFVATGQVRQGPSPKPEGLVAIRKVISAAMEGKKPIPVLVPWGSKKPINGDSVDVAEIMALRQLEQLQERVQRFYKPGVIIDVAVEDVGGEYLWQDEGSATLISSRQYVEDLVQLGVVLNIEGLHIIPESRIVEAKVFWAKAKEFFEPLYTILGGMGALTMPDALHTLQGLGWKGDVPQVMVDFYMKQYEKIYPAYSAAFRVKKLAMYLAQSAARYAVGAKVAFDWKDWVQVNFTQEIPGMPAGLADRRLFYRTIPAGISRTHLPPWRAQGYLLVRNDNTVTPRLEGAYTTLNSEHAVVTITREDQIQIDLRVEYVVEGV
jgi:hypothetical protein